MCISGRFVETLLALLVSSALVAGIAPTSWAQSSGLRGGVGGGGERDTGFETLESEVVDRFIVMEGSAEIRVVPEEIRVVMAVTHEAETAAACRQQTNAMMDELKQAWQALGISDDHVVVDFIAALPRYAWSFEQENGQDVAVERQQGYRMQTNIHLAVDTEAEAQQAISRAFELGLTDIIAFDYWSSAIEKAKEEARQRAMVVARRKADALLSSVVDQTLPVINLQEQTSVLYPPDLYASFGNSFGDSLERPSRRDLPLVHAFRPQNTYYRGPAVSVDAPATTLPMKPEISVLGRVRLYFASPAMSLRVGKSGSNTPED